MISQKKILQKKNSELEKENRLLKQKIRKLSEELDELKEHPQQPLDAFDYMQALGDGMVDYIEVPNGFRVCQ